MPDPPRELEGSLSDEPLEPGRHRLARPVAPTADGTRISIPVTAVVGEAEGPRVACVAGVHGDEYEGITALLELAEELDPADLAGTLVAVPVANPPAFRAGTRVNPVDGVDMNRIFPGDADGTVTERLAHGLFFDVVDGVDFLATLHGHTGDSLTVPYVEYPSASPVTAGSEAAARAFGAGYVDATDWHEGLLPAAASRAGVPAIEPEVGGMGATLPDRRALYKRGVRNVLAHLGVLAHGSGPDVDDPTEIGRHKLYAPSGGVLRWSVEIDEPIEAGDRLAAIVDYWGRELGAVTSPADGLLGVQRQRASVNPGDLVAMTFEPLD